MSRHTSGAGFLILLIGLTFAVPALAGQGSAAACDHVPSADSSSAAAFEMPVSLERIKHKLGERPRSSVGALRLQFYVEVFARIPALDVLKDVELTYGPVPYGAPTHSEFLAHWTPEAFRSPPVDLSASLTWLARWLTGSTGRPRSDQ